MNIFGLHWCIDETIALLSLIPFVGYFRYWLLNVWRKRHRKNTPCCVHKHEGEIVAESEPGTRIMSRQEYLDMGCKK